ncbi:hypothetical protein M0R45_003571 [Rubus argutus]|uniref:Uncharacterized protein n=1 Tax=Rubus argutus TaxID=59490 RepID=A0AAW1YFV1_RUBAR
MLQDSEDNVTSDGTHNGGVKDVASTRRIFESQIPPKYLKDLSKKELMELSDLNHMLDELGPRFKDWIGREPLPVDADLLPPVVLDIKLV